MKTRFVGFAGFPTLVLTSVIAIQTLPWSTTSDLLTQSPWTSMETWDDWDGDGVFTRKNEPFEDDNNWNFLPDKTYFLTEDTLVCEPELPLDTITAEWGLLNNDKVLRLSFFQGAEVLDFNIYSVGENEIVLYVVDDDNPTGPVREKVTLRR